MHLLILINQTLTNLIHNNNKNNLFKKKKVYKINKLYNKVVVRINNKLKTI